MTWEPTPDHDRITCRRLVGTAWVPCTYPDLLPGDIVKMVDPEGDLIHPLTLEQDEEAVAIVHEAAQKCDDLGRDGQTCGYGALLTVYESMAAMARAIKEGLN